MATYVTASPKQYRTLPIYSCCMHDGILRLASFRIMYSELTFSLLVDEKRLRGLTAFIATESLSVISRPFSMLRSVQSCRAALCVLWMLDCSDVSTAGDVRSIFWWIFLRSLPESLKHKDQPLNEACLQKRRQQLNCRCGLVCFCWHHTQALIERVCSFKSVSRRR